MPNKTTVIADPGRQDLTIIREFDAPRELVFKAHIDRARYVRWIGPRDLTTTIETFDMRDGGCRRYSQERGGHRDGFFGVNHEVLAPQRIVGTFKFDGLPERGHVIMGKTLFEELPDNRSRIVHHSVFFSVEDRDGMVKSGMERGVVDSYEKLDVVLSSHS